VNKHKAGLYRKFEVRRTDGSDGPTGKHADCNYFVLDITHDPFAIPALKAYAAACRKEYPNLSADLESLVEGNPLMPYRAQMPPGPRSLEAEAVPSAGASEIIVEAYQAAQDSWSAQCFCFTSAPESMRRDAHEVAREGFDRLVKILGPLARPILDAEYREADALARASASRPASPPEVRASRETEGECAD
jgi:hypothetical protein